jgi:hypothetical protein
VGTDKVHLPLILMVEVFQDDDEFGCSSAEAGSRSDIAGQVTCLHLSLRKCIVKYQPHAPCLKCYSMSHSSTRDRVVPYPTNSNRVLEGIT